MNDINFYTSEMKKSLMDKIFFIDKIESNRFIDFGCADGALIKFLSTIYPDNFYMGYDRSEKMIELAKFRYEEKNVFFTSNIAEVVEFAEGTKTTVIASSILHEIYGEGLEKEFWDTILKIDPQYIVIRDMCVSRIANRASDPNAVARVYQKFAAQSIEKWEDKWGNLFSNRSLLHFLLKYRFVKNWETEFEENYFPFNYEQLLNGIPNNYSVMYNEHYTLQYVKNQVKKDFDIDLQDRTHLKLILKRG